MKIIRTQAFYSLLPQLLFILAAAVLPSAQGVAQADLNDGPVASWSFEEDMIDRTGNGHDGTAQGATFTTDRFNRPGRACGFNGTTDYIEVAATSSLQMTDEITIVAWINCSGGGPWNPRIVSCAGNCPADLFGYELLTAGSGASRKLMFIFSDKSITSSQSFPEKTWHFVAGVATSHSLSIYLDGSLDSTVEAAPGGFRYGDSPLFIGNKAPGSLTFGDDIWGGAIDEVRIFDRALAAEEIQQLYVREASPSLSISRTLLPELLRLDASHLIIGRTYQVQSSTDLNTWKDFGLPFAATDTTDSQNIEAGAGCGFWRLKAVQ